MVRAAAVLASFLAAFVAVAADTADCWPACQCRGSYLACEGVTGLAALGPALRANVTSLNLNGNTFPVLDDSIRIPRLQKLDLSSNGIGEIVRDAFQYVPELQRLNLSSNAIRIINTDTFAGIPDLERLSLDRNQIVSLPSAVLDGLRHLKKLDISGNPLLCNCELQRMMERALSTGIKLTGNPKCANPPHLNGQTLKKLKIDCIISNDELLLRPRNSQVVFEGDSLRLKCIASTSTVGNQHELIWQLPDSVANATDVSVDNSDVYESGLTETTLSIAKLTERHSGNYSCVRFKSNTSDLSEMVRVIVVSDATEYCPPIVTDDNRGEYAWPGSVRGNLVSQPCKEPYKEGATAYHLCGSDGRWSRLNTSACPYVSNTTRYLEQFSLLNLTDTRNVLRTCQSLYLVLAQHTPPNGTLRDPDDIEFVVRALENYLKYADLERYLGSIILDIVNLMMAHPQSILAAAENLHGSCSALVHIVEDVTLHTSNIEGHKKNLVSERFPIKQGNFTGMTCVWYTATDPNGNSGRNDRRLFHCSTTNRTITPLMAQRNKIIHASIQIPGTLQYYRSNDAMLGATRLKHDLIVSMYDRGSFFTKMPSKLYDGSEKTMGWNYDGRKTHEDIGRLGITTPVVGVKLANISLVNPLLEPIYITVRDPGVKSGIVRAVLWNENIKQWSDSPDGCNVSHVVLNMVVIRCFKLGYVGLLQNVDVGINGERGSGAPFRFSHPAVYFGSGILLLCLVATIVTYALCYSAIHMTVKTKHSLINTWLAFGALCFMYTSGIYQTEDVRLCQTIGLLIHYLTLCCLLWICVTVSQLYKNLSKDRNRVLQSSDDEPQEAAVRKPILGIYLVGWGIAMIVCGISGAVDVKEYASYSHCFLNSPQASSTVFVPGGIVVVFVSILFLLIRCTIRNVNGQPSEGTQATENVDSEAWEPSLLVDNVDRRSERSMSDSEIEDTEHTPIVQLRAHVIVLCVYLIAWACGSLAVHPYGFHFSHREDVFSVLYALFAVILGLFILFFYGIARSDVRSQWLLMRCYFRKRKKCCRTRSVFDANARNVTNPRALTPISNAAAARAQSRSDSQSSNRPDSKLNNSNILKAAAEFNGRTLSDPVPGDKTSNMNLIVLHRQQYRSNNSVVTFPESENFYNANQSNVARKFFKKQKQNMRKNCLDISRRHFDQGSGVSDAVRSLENIEVVSNMFSSGAKVNNTNIHVERGQLSDTGIKESRTRNDPNIMSDDADDKSNRPPKRYILERDKRHNKSPMIVNIYTNIPETRVPQHQVISPIEIKNDEARDELSAPEPEDMPTMRTVSQQCSLEYSSTSEAATPMNRLGSDKTLNTEPISAACITHEIASDTDDAPSFDKYIDLKNVPEKRKHYTHRNGTRSNRSSTDLETESVDDPPIADSNGINGDCDPEQNYENESDIYFPHYQMSEVSIRSHGLYAPPPTSLCNDMDLTFGNGEPTRSDDYVDHYDDYDSSTTMRRYRSPALSCPDVNRLESPTSSVSEIDELYKQITIKDRRLGKPHIPHNARLERTMRHCESDSYISESHSDTFEPERKAETRV